jgi:hypothetical protein
VYWIDVIGATFGGGINGVGQNDANIATFRDWLTLNETTVELIREEEFNPTAIWNVHEDGPHRFWFLFRVNAPTVWGQELSLGWPSEGSAEMVSADTIQKPDPPPTIFDEEFEFPSWMKWTVVGVAMVAGGALIVATVRR